MTSNVRPWKGILPSFGARVYVDPLAVVVGQVAAGDDVSFWPFASVRGDVHAITIGARTNVQDGAVLHVTHDSVYVPGGLPLAIGADVVIGHQALLHACTVGDRCLVGMGSIVMDGAVVEAETIIAGGAVVPPRMRCEARGLYAGNPARRLRALTEREIEQIAYGARKYVEVKDEYLRALTAS